MGFEEMDPASDPRLPRQLRWRKTETNSGRLTQDLGFDAPFESDGYISSKLGSFDSYFQILANI